MKKMYICVKKSLESHKIVAAVHGVLMCHLKFHDTPDYQDWLKNSFRKVVCEVSDADFERLKQEKDYIIVNECFFENNPEVAIVFAPREEWPKMFKFFSLIKI